VSVAVVRADARALPLPAASVDLVVTSPPYFGLRSYTDGGEHYSGQIGSEATPREWLGSLLEATAEWVRVLKPGGSIFVNLGDKYAGGGQGGNVGGHLNGGPHLNRTPAAARNVPQGFQAKCLLGLPWRYALACVDDLGLILRAEIIWAKPNGLPESVTDRVRRAHEQVFHFTRQPRYYAAVDEIREPQLHGLDRVGTANRQGAKWQERSDGGDPRFRAAERVLNPLGKLPGSVWDIPSQPLTVPAHLGIDHFAAFPMELPRRIILGWSPPGVCTACGEGRRPVADVEHVKNRRGRQWNVGRGADDPTSMLGWESVKRITGYACACPQPDAPTRPALVLDPFGGTGTTALVATMHGRHGITVDRSADYCRLAAWRTADPAQRAAALQVPKPPPVPDGQDALFAAP
jgi:DNA modification methylase